MKYNTIRVVHITTVHYPFDTRIYHKQCRTLAENGFDVILISSYHEDIEKADENAIVELTTIPKSQNRLLRMTKSVFNAYKAAKKLNAQIYHFHDPELIPVGLFLKKKENIVIYDIHEDYVTSIKQKRYLKHPFIQGIVAGIYGFIEKAITKRFEIVLAEKYYYERFPEGKCILNYPSINRANDVIVNRATTNIKYLIYTGAVTQDRGAFIHAKIPSLVEDIEVSFIGLCSKGVAEKIIHIAGDKRSSIEIVGLDKYVSREEIDKKYHEREWLAGLAIFPPTEHYMRKELTKFFEYMYVGLPIICSDFPVWKEFIDSNKCGITVDPLNNEEIKNAILYLKNNPEIAYEMGQNGRKAVIDELNWDTEGKKLVEWYEGLIYKLKA